MRLAYFGYPHIGGTHSVFRHLRDGLRGKGIDVRWLGVGAKAHDAARDPRWSEDAGSGSVVPFASDPRRQTELLLDDISQQRFDGVFVNVLADRLQTNAARYMPRHLRRIMIVHSISPGTYAAAEAIREHVHATVCISRRIRDDLVNRGFASDRMSVISNATNMAPPLRGARPCRQGELRLLFLGRIDDQSKGVFWLPAILARLPQGVTLIIAGDGPDRPELERRCSRFGARVSFLGAVPSVKVPELVETHDVLIGPSRYEGFMITTVEAMAKGCVPVVSLIRGVTDLVVRDGENGFLFPVGDVTAAADAIRRLFHDPDLRRDMGGKAVATVKARYTVGKMAEAYATLIGRLMATPPPIAEPLSLDAWDMARGLNAGLRTRLPVPVKNLLRLVLERVA